jgi:type IV pilus assembly protein PilW
MTRSARTARQWPLAGARGLTLVELLVALLIGLFLIGGLISLLQGMKRATTVQTGMSQLVDNERFALDLLTDVIQTAGSLDPSLENPSSAFPAQSYPTTTAYPSPAVNYAFSVQQYLAGTGAAAAAAPGDTFVIRAATSGSDNLMNCVGATSTTLTTFVNIFSLDGAGNLQCQVYSVDAAGNSTGPVTATLVNGVYSMSVTYGIKSNITTNTLAADAYLDAAQINALTQSAVSGWSMVRSIQLTLLFVNPLYGATAQPSSQIRQFIPFTRVIDIMSATGYGQT